MDNKLDLKEFYYDGNDLGYRYSKEKTIFKVWSPQADKMEVILYEKWDDKIGEAIPMDLGLKGVWELTLNKDIKNKYYNYIITINGVKRETPDPYTVAASANGIKGMIVDLKETNPQGWDCYNRPEAIDISKAIIYEIHVRDFSVDPNSGMMNKGKYLAFTEKGTKTPKGAFTGLDHLKELGITHLHLLPLFDFQSVDETKENEYNWGYDPYLYNVPEGSYSTNPYDGNVRIREFKQMIKSLHENGIRVIMDVVYNHTYKVGDSPFDILMPKYYYRMQSTGDYSNGSGCGNEIASEKPMVRKFIVDSIKFWAMEYNIDGFRFDLMALHDIDTMKIIEKELRSINENIIIYGEPWTGGSTTLPSEHQMKKGSQRGMKISVFNDNIRNAIKGDNDGTQKGFALGAQGLENEIKKGVTGGINYSDSISDFTLDPTESINYVSSHDNLVLFDKIEKSNQDNCYEERIQMNKLSLAIVLTSQGVPFIQGGTDILRTKYGNHNSYNAGDLINQIDWQRKDQNIEYFNYIKGLIKLRKSQRVFSLSTHTEVKKMLTFLESPKNTVAFRLQSTFPEDWKDIVVVYNPNNNEVSIELPHGGEWKVLVNGQQSGTTALEDNSLQGDRLRVSPISTYVVCR